MFSLSQAQMAVAQGQPGYNRANLGTTQGGILPVGPSAEQVTAADMEVGVRDKEAGQQGQGCFR